MKIALLPFCAGTMELMMGLADALIGAGHDVHVFTTYLRPGYEKCVTKYKHTIVSWSWFDFTAIEDFAPDRVIFWNGHAPWTIAAYTYLKDKCNSLVVERAWLPQKDFNYISDGLAAHSLVRELAQRSTTAESEDLTPLEEKYATQYYDKKLPKKFMFIPGQLDQDTSISISSPFFKTIDSMIGFVQKCVGKDVPIVVKNHPLEPDKQRSDRIIKYSGALTSNELMAQAHVVVGLTSTCLVESLVHHRNVMSFGYNVAMDFHAYNDSSPVADMLAFQDAFFKLWNSPRQSRSLRQSRGLSTLLRLQWSSSRPPRWVLEFVEAGATERRAIAEVQGLGLRSHPSSSEREVGSSTDPFPQSSDSIS